MAIFTKSLIKNKKQDEKLLAKRWLEYQKYKEKSEYIKTLKEEKYQEGFFKDLFEACLGYTLDTTDHTAYNLEREKKNETDSKKADGVISIDKKVVGVVELKAQDSKNLDKAVDQAFGYLVSHSDARYVVVSNFDELRFYIDKKTEYEKFHLFSLDYESFKKLHLLLSFESIKEDVPLHLKEKTASFESDISKELYKDFSTFRTHLFENIVKNNDEIDPSKLLRLTQKLCDRIIFILFAEDRGLLNANTISEIRKRHELDVFGNSLYEYYKIYFHAVNEGNEKLNIPKYNGGLFAKDEELDSLKVDDNVLDMEAQKLSDYDFDSEVSVNILGHIFEQSLTDLEEIQASIEQKDFDKKRGKRKKDGVFYTPEYITRYIVQNTLGKLCQDKQKELGIEEITPPKNAKKPTKKEQKQKQNLEQYRKWLLELKILDPACGSGAFLNQALEYLIAQHSSLLEKFVTMGDITATYEIEKNILENNLYGVDINEDATEIAKLSLWLRTAHRGRELTKLADKIVCANSLLEMPFDEGSFDVVIGNPPYVRVQGLKSNYEDEAKLYEQRYESATGNYDIYALFLEQSYKMIKPQGKVSYILPHKFLIADFGKGLRSFLSKNKAVEELLHFGSEMVFEDASTYTCIITLSHNNKELKFKHTKPSQIFDLIEYDAASYEKFNENKWNLSNHGISKVLEKINKQPLRVQDVFAKIFQGIATSGDDVYLLLKSDKGLYSKALDKVVEVEEGLLKPMLKGEDISRYKRLENRYCVLFPYVIESGKAMPMSEEYIKEHFPSGYAYLKENETFLRGREKGRFDNHKEWFLFSRQQGLNGVEQEKIITPYMGTKSQMSFDDGKFYHNTKGFGFVKKENIQEDYKYFLALLNSSLMWFFIKNTSTEFRGGYFTFTTTQVNPFPLPKLKKPEQQEPFVQKANLMLELNKQLQETKKEFLDELELQKIPKKLQNFESLEFEEFVKEYKKAKKLKFADKLEERNFKNDWKALFENDKKEVLELQGQIDKTDKEIDAMVYDLYGLSEDEIKIVESSNA